jgi:pimeloyl-ACP methyl ester carboxylesterase
VSPLRSPGRCSGPAAYLAAASLALSLSGCQSLQPPPSGPLGPRLDGAIQVLAAPGSSERARAEALDEYRRLTAAHLQQLLHETRERPLTPVGDQSQGGIRPRDGLTELQPVIRPRLTRPELHRAGLGLPLVARIAPEDPNAPVAGYQVPLTLIALPEVPPSACCETALVDPDRVGTVRTVHGDLPLAMDLETPLAATVATGPRLGAGIFNLLRPGRFTGRPRIVFLQPFDPDRIPVVLVHGLMSTPRMWEPLVKDLLTDPEIRARCQFWFFYYPTGQPVPLSALQLREALDDAVKFHGVTQPMILLGHSMGGILSRAQVSGLTLEDAQDLLPAVVSLPESSPVRRALVFEPRTDVARAIFLFTPHRGSRLASSGLGAWGIRLIRLPDTLLSELGAVADQLTSPGRPRLPTSIHGLSPDSPFLGALDRTRPTVPTHTILGDRGRGDGLAGSDGVVPYLSAHLPSAESELVVPTGHGGFAHPQSVAEIKRIIRLALAEEDKRQAAGSLAQGPGTAGRPQGTSVARLPASIRPQ